MLLLQYTSTPMQYRFNSEGARLEYNPELATHTTSKQGGDWEYHAKNVEMRMDSTEFHNDLGYKTPSAAMGEAAARGKRAQGDAVARYVDLGNQVAQIQQGATIPDALYSRMMQDWQGGQLALTPTSPVNISWNGPELSMNYQPVSLNFDWKIAQSAMEFVPGRFSVEITQYPKLNIEYIGKPIYVPASADPDYQATA
ncbi:MAG: DUF6470 family protein [Angelakisella sp.]